MFVPRTSTHSGICKPSQRIFPEGVLMYTGPLVFTQVMDFMPLKTFQRYVDKYQGNFSVKNFTLPGPVPHYGCTTDLSGEFPWDIEACLRAQSNKLYHMGIRSKVSRSTLAEANEMDRRIYAGFCPSSDRHRQEALPEGTVGSGTSKHGLRLWMQRRSICACPFFPGHDSDRQRGCPTSQALLDLWAIS